MHLRHRILTTLSLGLVGFLVTGCLNYKPLSTLSSAPKPTNKLDASSSTQTAPQTPAEKKDDPVIKDADDLPADTDAMTPFAKQVPIYFVTRSQNAEAWDKLKEFWNRDKETVADPVTGASITRDVIRIKVPLGLTQPPPVPVENPLTLEKWMLGKKLYFDPILSYDGKVACATCHDPAKGFTDQLKTSRGINGQVGGMNAPTVINSTYNDKQFWDGRAGSLELQAQGPVGNPVEMMDITRGNPDVHAWPEAVNRLRGNEEYRQLFRAVFGTLPTRDGAAKAMAAYERTVLSGNALHDRAQVAMLKRAEEEGKPPVAPTTKDYITAKDYEAVLKEAKAKKDDNALKALGLEVNAEDAKLTAAAASLANGRNLFFGKARCNTCHAGDNFTDNQFHNLGVGVVNGKLPEDQLGRYARLDLGHKNPIFRGAFKTPTLRSLLTTAPYMHDGSEKTLEETIKFYDRGGNANDWLDISMRDVPKETEYRKLGAAEFQKKYPNLKVHLAANKQPIIPLQLSLTEQEQKDLVLFLKALQGDPIPAVVADPKLLP
jgi:cytochrome c peroxidase